MRSGEDKNFGIYRKFIVKRTDGGHRKGKKHERCFYFVLDIVHDEFSRPALRAYAKAAKKKFPWLAKDIGGLLRGMSPANMPDWNERP